MDGTARREVSHGDGNGWVVSADGARRWGRHGAAGLLLRAPSPEHPGEAVVLLQHRARWTASGGTWALPGGAIDSHEDAATAALRETEEEAAVAARDVTVRAALVTSAMRGTAWARPQGAPDLRDLLHSLRPDQDVADLVPPTELPPLEQVTDDEVEWTYTTVVADAAHPLDVVANNESLELRWVPESHVADLPLMPAFAEAWEGGLRAGPVELVLDVANILGSRPDGWWKDRAGHTARLLHALAAELPRTLALPGGGFGWSAGAHAVLEGAARAAAEPTPDTGPGAGPRVHHAAGSGDDAIVELTAGLAGRGSEVVVVTADRGLRERLAPGVVAVGPSVLDSRRG